MYLKMMSERSEIYMCF